MGEIRIFTGLLLRGVMIRVETHIGLTRRIKEGESALCDSSIFFFRKVFPNIIHSYNT